MVFLFLLGSLGSSCLGLYLEHSRLKHPMNRSLSTSGIESETPQEVSSVSGGADEVVRDGTRLPLVRLQRLTGIFIELAARSSARRILTLQPLLLRLLTQCGHQYQLLW